DGERQGDDVVAVVGRDEELVGLGQQLGHRGVRAMLELLHLVLRRSRRPFDEAAVDGVHDRGHALAGTREPRVDLAGSGTEPDPHQKITLTGNHISAATAAAAGIVSTHAVTMFPATPQRTAERRFVAPTPMTAPETTCVVESG